MNLISKVYGSLKWKKSDEACAAQLKISLEKYRQIKEQITAVKELIQSELDFSIVDLVGKKMVEVLDEEAIKSQYISELEDNLIDAMNKQSSKIVGSEENLDSGEGKIEAISAYEPKTPEEIEELVKIKDSPKWKLSHYYVKQQPNGVWRVTALVSRKKLDGKNLLEETLKNFVPKYQPVFDPVFLNTKFERKTCCVLSLQDLHFGKEGNDKIVSDFNSAVATLVQKAYQSHYIDEIVYVMGGDLLNMDTFMGSTTKGTPVDNSQRAQEAYSIAFDALFWSINYLKQYCNTLKVIYIPGNHDRLSSYHMAHALSKCFSNVPGISFDAEYGERKVHIYGHNFFAFEHGDAQSKTTPLVYATEFPKQWGQTHYRTCYTGHYHKKKSMEYVTEDEVHGFTLKILPSLCQSDYWHYHNKYTGAKRQAILDIHDEAYGKIGELIYTAK